MNVYLPNLRLPSSYQEVEYIQSSWTQYINTWYIPSNNTKIEMSMWGWNTVQQFQNLFWARLAFSSTGRWFHLWYNTQYMYYAMFWKAVDIQTSVLSFIDGSNYIIQMSQDWIYQNWTQKYTFSSATFTSPVNLTLFALNDNGTVKEQWAFKMYYTKIWDNGTLVRNFIPCYRVSDNVIWLFDKVENKFYANAWTGTFSKGNDVTMAELKNAYIGEYKGFEYSYDFRNKTTSQVTADGWVIRQWWCSFNSYWVRNNSSDWKLKMTNKVVWLQQKMTSCKKLIIEFTRYTTGEAAFAWGMVTESKMGNLLGVYQDNRLWEITISVDSSNILQLSWTISWTVKFRWEFDLINKTAALSWNWNSPTTVTLTDDIITKIRNEYDAAYIYFRWNPGTSNLWGLSDISIKIEY